MSDSNAEWGKLAEYDTEIADLWDGYERLPEPGDNDVLDAFCERKNLTIASLVKAGARISGESVLAFAYAGGIKFRDIVSGKKWSHLGSTYNELKIIPAEKPSDVFRVIVCEGETDSAWLSLVYPYVDIAVMPAGALHFPSKYAQQLVPYDVVLVALDLDASGERGAKKILDALNTAVRFPPPHGKDWCQNTHDAAPELPEGPPPETKVLVPVKDMLTMEVPDIASWFDHELLPIGGLMFLHGWTKGFKSYISLDMMASLAQGEPWCHFEAMEEPCKIAVMQFELPWPYYHQRISKLYDASEHKDLLDENFFTWTPLVRPQLIAGNSKQEGFILKNLVDEGIQVLLLDPIRRAIGTLDMNAENEVRKMLSFFERLNNEGITVVAVHHDSKEGAKSGGGNALNMTGSGAWAGDPDTIVSIEIPRHEDELSSHRNLRFMLNHGPAPGVRGMEILDDGHIKYITEGWNGEPDPDSTNEPSI